MPIFPGGSHAQGDTHREQVNRDLLAFLRG